MKKIDKSIDELTAYLQKRGYDSLFTLNGSSPESLSVLLKDKLVSALRDPMAELLPVAVEMITALPDDAGYYSRCVLNIDYNPKHGVHVKSIDLQLWKLGQDRLLFSQHRKMSHRRDIPSKIQGNKSLNGELTNPKKRKLRRL
ncbi:hypothetical protein [Chitinophaga sp. MM2321]|uniref:hypothetical protein n=1 Tax=Chitinophaga sp. MM2321 TaxID=3137178 RepID=UPI0032D5AC89